MFKLSNKQRQSLSIIQELSTASIKSRFRSTWGGILWVLLNPLIIYSVHCFVLAKVLHINLPNLPLYLLGGVLPWTFFATTLEMSPNALTSSRQLLYSFSISPFVIIAILVVENFITFLMSFSLLTVILLFLYRFPLHNLFFFPIAVLILFFFTVFTATTISILNVFYRDVKFIVSFALSIFFFLTPILYPEKRFPVEYRWIVDFNPLYKVILPLRTCIYDFDATLNSSQLIGAFTALGSSLLLTLLVWTKYKNELIKKL